MKKYTNNQLEIIDQIKKEKDEIEYLKGLLNRLNYLRSSQILSPENVRRILYHCDKWEEIKISDYRKDTGVKNYFTPPYKQTKRNGRFSRDSYYQINDITNTGIPKDYVHKLYLLDMGSIRYYSFYCGFPGLNGDSIDRIDSNISFFKYEKKTMFTGIQGIKHDEVKVNSIDFYDPATIVTFKNTLSKVSNVTGEAYRDYYITIDIPLSFIIENIDLKNKEIKTGLAPISPFAPLITLSKVISDPDDGNYIPVGGKFE